MALSDNSGTSTGPHLHFELRLNGTVVNPCDNWAGNEPFPVGYRDQNGYGHGPFRLDRPKIYNAWIAHAQDLGSPIENDWTSPGGCLLEGTRATLYLQRFERGYIHYCGTFGQAQIVYYNRTFLPIVQASELSSDWNSTLYIRNLNAGSSATVSITFFTEDGHVLDSRVYEGLLPANGTWEVHASDIAFDALLNDLGNSSESFAGSALVAADQDVAVVVRTEKTSGGVLRHVAYTGVSDANTNTGWGQPGRPIYAPVVYYHPPWGDSQWESTIHVQNTGDEATSITIRYYDLQGNEQGTRNDLLPVNGKGDYQPSDWPGFVGSAHIESAQPLAVVVAQEDQSASHWGAMHYNAFSAGSTQLHLPSMFHSYYAWDSSFTVQNLGNSDATVRVVYYPESGGSITCPPFTLSPQASRMVCQFNSPPPPAGCGISGCSFPVGQQGTAIVSSLYGG